MKMYISVIDLWDNDTFDANSIRFEAALQLDGAATATTGYNVDIAVEYTDSGGSPVREPGAAPTTTTTAETRTGQALGVNASVSRI